MFNERLWIESFLNMVDQCVHTNIYIYRDIFIYMHTCLYIYIYTHTYIYIIHSIYIHIIYRCICICISIRMVLQRLGGGGSVPAVNGLTIMLSMHNACGWACRQAG